MEKWIEIISKEVERAFEAAGYDRKYGKAVLSNRPDLCEYQCNGALAAAKQYKKSPLIIAREAADQINTGNVIEAVEVAPPGFINMMINKKKMADYLQEMFANENLGVERSGMPRKVIIDYGGPNVAKPLHVGHLRSAIIGESIKRLFRFLGHHVLGDIHMGDWGYQMGLIMTEMRMRDPELVYFNEEYRGEYPKEPPFSLDELEDIYPLASKRAGEDSEYRDEALKATYELQRGRRGYRALWKHIMDVSVGDLKKNYQRLQVDFDLWKGEADAQPFILPMIEDMKKRGMAREDQGALVVDVREKADTKEIPPCMILKSDGASLYGTTDLATLIQRMRDYDPDQIIYVVDKRQELHFTQVFRAAKKTGIVPEKTALSFLGFGTMNGRDGKAFKTREGGVMRLSDLLEEIEGEMLRKIEENKEIPGEEASETVKLISLAAVKYGDLSNQAGKDYVFDIQRFTSFEGNTGPYILYTIVRMKSILSKYAEENPVEDAVIMNASENKFEKNVMQKIAHFSEVMENACEELAPHKICAYVYDLADTFGTFYHNTRVLTEVDEEKRRGYIAMIRLARTVMEKCISVLGFEAPERM